MIGTGPIPETGNLFGRRLSSVIRGRTRRSSFRRTPRGRTYSVSLLFWALMPTDLMPGGVATDSYLIKCQPRRTRVGRRPADYGRDVLIVEFVSASCAGTSDP